MAKTSSSSFEVMAPQHTAEKAYSEWLVLAIEIVAQSRTTMEYTDTVSRQFALIVPERFSARQFVDAKNVLQNRQQIVMDVKEGPALFEQWTFSFDSPKDVIPAVRSERRDQTLPRRLAVALRSLMSLARILKPVNVGTLTVTLRYEAEPTTPCPALSRVDVCSIPSSFGNMRLRVASQSVSGQSTRAPSFATTPVPTARLRIDENFIQSHSSLPNIQMIIQVEPVTRRPTHESTPPVSRSVPVSQSPPRELAEIWPTSNLAYPASPRKSSFGSDDIDLVGCCLSLIPDWPEVASESAHAGQADESLTEIVRDGRSVNQLFEKPVPVAAIIDSIEQLKRSHQKLLARYAPLHAFACSICRRR